MAATVPWLDLFVSLLGAVKMSTLSIMAPALIDTASNWDNLGVLKWKAGKKLQKLDFKYVATNKMQGYFDTGF